MPSMMTGITGRPGWRERNSRTSSLTAGRVAAIGEQTTMSAAQASSAAMVAPGMGFVRVPMPRTIRRRAMASKCAQSLPETKIEGGRGIQSPAEREAGPARSVGTSSAQHCRQAARVSSSAVNVVAAPVPDGAREQAVGARGAHQYRANL